MNIRIIVCTRSFKKKVHKFFIHHRKHRRWAKSFTHVHSYKQFGIYIECSYLFLFLTLRCSAVEQRTKVQRANWANSETENRQIIYSIFTRNVQCINTHDYAEMHIDSLNGKDEYNNYTSPSAVNFLHIRMCVHVVMDLSYEIYIHIHVGILFFLKITLDGYWARVYSGCQSSWVLRLYYTEVERSGVN